MDGGRACTGPRWSRHSTRRPSPGAGSRAGGGVKGILAALTHQRLGWEGTLAAGNTSVTNNSLPAFCFSSQFLPHSKATTNQTKPASTAIH